MMRIRPTIVCIAIAALLGFASLGISRPPPGQPARTRHADIGWMVGHWSGDEGGFAEETWNEPRGGAMA